ncbi:reverse transcriptase (RNA-dependent DNA polymerase) domain-containing protein [Hirsutella rhossiliensis]|uniref:RNA-directed DNA polymerase n=1 Tax=Hirsutella rhossiliensis TaxID=111463 RepID=A0A9P8SLS8_9HYPO|nr:reverse transcriptase (RNA-dependent DNA polymerase) domain-containing protein [Hirsutella rhossiliensis]KAH0966589.1 reverse transcriptase (RNA-dependent DNA polymerase) domain-containing protein [Hirsutella rhossiliensis]
MVLAPDLFLDYLNRRYGDPNAKARALDRLRSLKQKPDESFASFFPKFEKELADSGDSLNFTNDNKAASRGQERNGLGTRESKSVDKRQEGPEEKQFVPLEERKCYECGKLGHLAAKCPGKERRQQRVKSPRRVLAGIPPMTIRKRVAPDENRRQERAKAEAEWATQKDEMDCEGLYVNFGINREYFTTAFVDCGCLCYGTISERLARKLHLPRIPIKPRALEQVNTFSPEAICAVTYFDFDIDGYQKKRAFFYVVRDQTDPVILGKKWLNQEDVTCDYRRTSCISGRTTIGLTELLDKGFIRASSSPASAPVLFKDRYPLPLIEETLRSLSKAKWLTKLDVIAAFHKIRVEEGDEWKTAFRTRYGLYEWLVTPFGLTGAPATFQRYINHTLRDFLDEFCSAYIDDILIYSSDAGLQIDIDKCDFEAKSVKYLGFIVEAGKGIRVDPEKVFSNIAAPLTALTKKDAVFAWSKECDKAFEELKALLTSAPVLAQWDPDRETIVETDSSGYVTGGALSQKGDDGIMRPVAFFSKKNAPAECNYPIHDKELLAIIRRLEHWDAELRSVKSFTVLTDHLNLRYFTKKQQLSERQARWAETLSRYSFTIKHRPGKEAVVPDTLSRREQDMPHSAEDDRLQGRRVQLLQRNKGGLVTKVKSGYVTKGDTDQPDDATTDQDDSIENPFSDPELQKLWDEGVKKHNRYWLIRKAVQQGERRLPSHWGLPVMLSECSIDDGQRLCWRERIWVPNHEPCARGLCRRRLDSDVRQFPLPIPDRIWSELSIDFVTDLPPTKSNGSTNLMVVTDRLSKSVVLESLKDITAETTARALLRNVVQHHGVPRAIDNWEELLPAAMMAINNHNSTSTGLSPFFITHGYHVDLIQVKEKLRTDGRSPVTRAESIVQRFREATEWAQAAIASAQEQQEKNANSRRQPSDQFKPGDKVWLRLRNIRSNRPSKKLDWLSAKYTVLRPLGHTRRLDTPPGIHNVFHVSLLRLAADDPLPSQTSDDYRPPAILTDDGELWKWKRFWTGRKSERVESVGEMGRMDRSDVGASQVRRRHNSTG